MAPGILVITWNYPPRQGGMEQLLARLCEGLRRELSVTVITAFAGGAAGAADDGILRAPRPGLVSFFYYALCQGAALLRANKNISMVFAGSVLVTPLVLGLAKWFRRRAVVQAHGLDIIYPQLIYQWLIVGWLRYADAVIANSQHTAGLARGKGVAAAAITVIPPGVDAAVFSRTVDVAALKPARGLAGRRVILFVGRLARRKGVKEFIEHCLVQIANEMAEACLVIVGDNPTESLTHHDDVAGELRATISRLKLSDHVRWLGAVNDDELVQLYGLADLLILPILALKNDVEGFGIVALEAAAAGKPVVATRAGGVADAVVDGQTGMLVEPGDYAGLTRAVLSLLRDPQRARQLGESGQARARRDYSWEKICRRYSAAFRSLGGVG